MSEKVTQSGILKASYEAVHKNLIGLSGKVKLFEIGEEGAPKQGKDGNKATVCLCVGDLSQLYLDKNGQTVEVEETIFEAPTQIGYMLHLVVISKSYPALLGTAGLLIQYFKDNNVIYLPDYKWHGEEEGKIVIEPVIRNLESRHEPQFCDGFPAVTLSYRVEMGINSLKGTPFKRVEKRTITGNLMDDKKGGAT